MAGRPGVDLAAPTDDWLTDLLLIADADDEAAAERAAEEEMRDLIDG